MSVLKGFSMMVKSNCSVCIASGVAFLCLTLASGCNRTANKSDFMSDLCPVSGTVKLNGKPAEGVQVTFVPRQGIGTQNDPTQGRLATGTTDAEGNFTLFTPPGGAATEETHDQFAGALPGKYAVTFSLWVMSDGTPWAVKENQERGPMASGATDKVPPQFGNPQATPHQVEVKGEDDNSFDFDVKLNS